ncbi:MAG: FliO/MopB family protein [Verrucomicrobia bacterium]|nr:FliO/MopB family protein [Verrucomicrobiota bacterium]
MNPRAFQFIFLFAGAVNFGVAARAAETNPVAGPALPLPEAGASVLRVFGALALVIALFLGGVWLFRNWQRLVVQRGQAPKLNILESRPLGNRHGLHVIGYERQRLLIASSPNGLTLISQLAAADTPRETGHAAVYHPSSEVFKQVLARAIKPASAETARS